jgi:hypothetical protein
MYPLFQRGVETFEKDSPFGKGGSKGDLRARSSRYHGLKFLNQLPDYDTSLQVEKVDVVYEENCFAHDLGDDCVFWMLGLSQQREILWRPSSAAD